MSINKVFLHLCLYISCGALRYHYVDPEPVPRLHEIIMSKNLDAEVRASGFDESNAHDLLVSLIPPPTIYVIEGCILKYLLLVSNC